MVEQKKVKYDYLALTTGSKPAVPKLLKHVLELDNVFTVKNVEDGISIRKTALKSKSAIVIGAGAIGLEVATALKKLGLKVTLIEALNKVLPALIDDDINDYVLKNLKEYGISVITNKPVVDVRKFNSELKVQTSDGSEFSADFVVLAVGLRPNIELALKIGVRIGELGGVVVDEHMRTSINDIYAAGDVVQVKHLLTGKPVLSLFASTAFKEGRIAGLNIAGIKEMFKGTLIPWLVATNAINIGGVGLNQEICKKEGIQCVATSIEALDKEPYESDVKRVLIKLIVKHDDYRILGAQVLSKGDISKYIDLLTLAIESGKTIKDLATLELTYQPKYSALLSPVFVTAESLYRRILRKYKSKT